MKAQPPLCLFHKSIPSPETIARHSPRARRAHQRMQAAFRSISHPVLRRMVGKMLGSLNRREASCLIANHPRLRQLIPQTVSLLATKLSYSPWWAAPAASAQSHHPYPGGWLIHNATNIDSMRGLVSIASSSRGLSPDRDMLLAAMLLHDWAKPRMYTWREREILKDEGEAGHHLTAILEAFLQGMPDDVLMLLAGIHAGWWKKPEEVQSFLEKAGRIAGSRKLSNLARHGLHHQWSAEGWIARMAEEAWYTAARSSIQHIGPHVRSCLNKSFPGADVTGLEQVVWAWRDEIVLAKIYELSGIDGLCQEIESALSEAAACFSFP